MSNKSRLAILFIALIGIAGLSFFIFSEDNVDQQTNIQSEAEIETTTTTLINSTTSTSTTTTLMETTTTTSTTSSSTTTTTTTTIPPNQTAIFATQEEINNSKKISYDYLQSGCKKDEPNNTDEEWIKPLEVFTYDENKINFNLFSTVSNSFVICKFSNILIKILLKRN